MRVWRIASFLVVCILLTGISPAPPGHAAGLLASDGPVASFNPLAPQPQVLTLRVQHAAVVTIAPLQLAAAGWDLATLDPRTIHVWRRGIELPAQIGGADDGRLDPEDMIRFVASGNDSPFSTEATYWLSFDDRPGLRAPLPANPSVPFAWEQDNLYQSRGLTWRGDRWFLGEVTAAAPDPSTLHATLDLPATAAAGTRLQIAAYALARRPGHRLTVAANGAQLGTLTWDDPPGAAGPLTLTLTLPHDLPAGPLGLDLTLATQGQPIDTVLIDRLVFPDLPIPLPTLNGPALTPHPPLDLRRGPLPGQPGADVLIITHPAFRPALAPLVAAKQALGRQVAVIDIQEIYDSFSFGERDPEAIRALIRTAVASWSPPPRSVVLVGVGSVRMRVAAGTPDPTFIPPYLVDADPELHEIACDTCYTRLDGPDVLDDLLPDLPIGRLPVRSLAEAQTVVDKTVSYLMHPPAGAWQTQALILADNDYESDGTPDRAGSFVATAERAAALLPPGMRVQRFYYAPDRPTSVPFYRDPGELRCRLFRAIDGGAVSDTRCPPLPTGAPTGAGLWLYVGHASPWQWAATSPDAEVPYLWYLYDADVRHNGERLPILLAMTCLSGDFANPTLMTNDERLVLQPGGGVVAALSATGLGVNHSHEQLLAGLLPRLFAAADRTLGAAHLAGLARLLADGQHPELAYTFGILGDPDVMLPQVPDHALYVPLIRQNKPLNG